MCPEGVPRPACRVPASPGTVSPRGDGAPVAAAAGQITVNKNAACKNVEIEATDTFLLLDEIQGVHF